ncbi:MAG: hypothetical protein AVDCRST_MAG68-1656 [uncultured Gemmatimonadetes bacterium]|uniref:Uncharacterized protein n=1 Tax=uncultured Gemmatimonadota bacterium TaxID=203437 RepID=A0A6J4KUL3_9BACT|nr:MAG: hypothetical protein AVDCRST_MAG68-1656 [uncultured Gemmatimonadota bacterium]
MCRILSGMMNDCQRGGRRARRRAAGRSQGVAAWSFGSSGEVEQLYDRHPPFVNHRCRAPRGRLRSAHAWF